MEVIYECHLREKVARAKGAAVVQIYLTFETQSAKDKGERHYLLPSNDLAQS